MSLQTNHNINQHPADGFANRYGLHSLTVLVTFATDQMLFVGELAGGLGLVLAVPVAVAVGFIAYHAQMRFFGDDDHAAKVKAAAIALLCAIPTGLPAFLTIPAGVLGLFKKRG